ncbi:hypothetical protein [uncultured Aquimarina sp.]|uniref:DUF7477 domain-containing protein n=1 Tax=uncultured Aquimarina sp. TaxID=575652 RepID=UPI0026386333|nr:hypothetical protein [uncultured Aquimarina sp.]
MKYNYLFIVLIGFMYNVCYTQQSHYIILQQSQKNQSYTIRSSFPKDWIKTQWDLGYRITHVGFKKGEWFVVSEKKPTNQGQYYMLNPNNQQIKDKLNDGYTIESICPYVHNNRIKSFYLFNKISVNPVSNSYFSGTPGYNKNILKRVKKGWDRGWLCKSARSLTYNYKTIFSVLMPKERGNHKQIAEYRVDFPRDLINNKRSQGYILSSITYDHYKKAWFVVMTKKAHNGTSWGNITTHWTWVNYKSQKDKFKDYFENKGYRIIGVF